MNNEQCISTVSALECKFWVEDFCGKFFHAFPSGEVNLTRVFVCQPLWSHHLYSQHKETKNSVHKRQTVHFLDFFTSYEKKQDQRNGKCCGSYNAKEKAFFRLEHKLEKKSQFMNEMLLFLVTPPSVLGCFRWFLWEISLPLLYIFLSFTFKIHLSFSSRHLWTARKRKTQTQFFLFLAFGLHAKRKI